ncbi:Phosphatidylinositol-4-phosphate 5-kinase type-1 alpha family protein [Onchocerca flexuosa]|uniref:Phosphatidylinositol-4-phosphate 5-kinase type-1 alpha family protein n=1 Tax=Onchocerca flexuosa TaxID=387005 RepID=A0A238BUH0_9BILA|nr:Phosphatidylinositol-4-phosphate 5-kinase type-1 alpha family protein [Onchocerca flexuosa]
MGSKKDEISPSDVTLNMDSIKQVNAKPLRANAFSAEEEMRNQEEHEKQKIGHRRIDRQGEVSYKRVPSNALMGAIQLGIANSVGSLASIPKRDLLLQDFDVIHAVSFPSSGSQSTPSHNYGDFRFQTYAPIAFRTFRDLFAIKTADFLRSVCMFPLKELSNAGASGSIFYVSHDDQFIIKTVQSKEAEFLKKLLPGYYMNFNQNPHTLLPKFFGLFCYQSLGKNIRLLLMNNLLPQTIMMHEKYDLKGSTYKRLASKHERAKASPTLKDLDFISEHPDGLLLDVGVYDAIMKTISRDCLVLESFKIMDYSLLVGIHNKNTGKNATDVIDGGEPSTSNQKTKSKTVRVKSEKLLDSDYYKTYEQISFPARNQRGDDLLLFLGIIDILQNYRLLKKLEHTWKSVLHDGDTISVHNPTFYAQRFITFLKSHVFHMTAAELAPKGSHTKFKSVVTSYLALRHSPSKRFLPRRSLTEKDEAESATLIDTSRRPFSNLQKPREKKIERLFAPDPDPTEILRTTKSHSSEENIMVSFLIHLIFYNFIILTKMDAILIEITRILCYIFSYTFVSQVKPNQLYANLSLIIHLSMCLSFIL